MDITRQDMIDIIINAFEDYGYKSSINKRLGFGFNISPLTYADCTALNSVVKELDNPMLHAVYFDPIMTTDNFDLCICRLLYASGHWEELCHYIMVIKETIKDCDYLIEESETEFIISYIRNFMITILYVDCQKIGVRIITIISQEKEF